MSAYPPRSSQEATIPGLLQQLMPALRAAMDTDALGDGIRLDICETAQDYRVRAELPGAHKDSVRVTVDRNFVNIAADIPAYDEDLPAGSGAARVLLREGREGPVTRGFSLAHDIDAGRVQARYDNGLLHLVLPKRESNCSRTIAAR